MHYLNNIKRTDRRTTRWNLFFKYLGITFSIIIAFGLVPLYLKYIPSELYGVWLATGNILTWMTLLEPGLGGTMQYKIAYAFGNKQNTEIGSLIGNSFLVTFGYILLLAIAALYLNYHILDWLHVDLKNQVEFSLALKYTSIAAILMVFSYNIQGINYGLQSSLDVGLISSLMNFSGIITVVWFLQRGDGLLAFGYMGLVRSSVNLIGNSLYLFVRINIEKYKLTRDWSGIKDLIKLFVLTFFGKTASTLQGRMFEFLIAKYVSSTTAVNFRVSFSAPDNSKQLIIRPALSLSPVISRLQGTSDNVAILNKLKQMVYFVVWGAVFLFSAFFLFNQSFVSLLFGSKFYFGTTTNTLICILIIVAAISEILSQFVWALGDINKNNIATVIQLFIFLAIGIVACIKYGVNGLVISSILSYLSVSIWYFIYLLNHKLAFTFNSLWYFTKESFLGLAIGVILINIFKNVDMLTWPYFLINILLFTLLYLSMLFIVSMVFRNIVITYFKRKYLKSIS